MTDKVYNAAIIGLGIMGGRMIGQMAAHASFGFSGAWDPSDEACSAAQSIVPGLIIAADARSLINDPATDLVYIACPPAWHKEYAVMAMEAGKPVYCEKPLGVDIADSRDFVARLEDSNTSNIINFAQASARAIEITDQRLQNGDLGDISGVDVIVHFARWPRDWQADADWLRYRDQGGYTREVFSHFIYLVERFFGPAELVDAAPVYQADPALCETHVTATLKCGEVPVKLLGSSGGAGPDRVEMTIHGSKLSHRLHDWFELQTSDGGAWQQQLEEHGDLRGDSFRRQLDAVARWMAGDDHTLASAADALSVQVLVEGILAGPRA